jgi:hypothetical protein
MNTKGIMLALIVLLVLIGPFLTVEESNTKAMTTARPMTQFQTSDDYNISSYIDFSEAALNVLLEKMVIQENGSLYHSGDYKYEMIDYSSSLTDFYWTITSLAKMYWVSVEEGSANTTLSILMSRAANRMVAIYLDPDYPGFGINTFSDYMARTSKRAGIQAYAYEALSAAEAVNSSLDFSGAKASAISCLVNMLFDNETGGFYFFTLQNGSLAVPSYFDEVYPNDAKRLDHLALGAIALYDASVATSNATLRNMADRSMSFMMKYMKRTFQTTFYGLKLAVNANGSDIAVGQDEPPATLVVTDINAIALRALLKAYNVTGNATYLTFAEDTFQALLHHNWDAANGGWYEETLDGEPYAPVPYNDEDEMYYKYSEIQFQMVLTMEQLYQVTGDTFYIRTAIDTLDLVLSNLWDPTYGGFYQNGNQQWIPLGQEWQIHLTGIQGLGILALQKIWSFGLPIISYVSVNPSNPRPYDPISVSALVSDPDGVDCVYINYTMTLGTKVTEGVMYLEPNPSASGLYNNTFGTLNDTTQVNFYVYANDTTGMAFVAGSYYFVVRHDIWPPVITLRGIYPTNATAGQNITLRFGTYEFPLHSITECCTLFWAVNGGRFHTVNMTLIGYDADYLLWESDIGAFKAGDVITYYCMSVDEAGNWGASPYYKLTIPGPVINLSPFAAWQLVAIFGAVAAPGFGAAYVYSRKKYASQKQRTLKKEAKKRGQRARGKGRSRSRTGGDS